MKYIKATEQYADDVFEIVQNTIISVYPKYYPKEVVDLFCKLHGMEKIMKDIKDGNVRLLINDGVPVGTGSYIINHITRVYVLPIYQQKGYGSFIMNKLEEEISKDDTLKASDSMFYYKGGFFVIHSREMFQTVDPEKLCAPLMAMFGEKTGDFRIGISSVHHLLWQMKNCFEESRYAASLTEKGRYRLYEGLGIYKIILPYCEDKVMRDFCAEYIKPLEDYDLETNGNLLETAVSFVMNDGDLQKTADTMAQHKNTIRYRLKNISNITGINALETRGYEILSMAVRIYICNNNGESREKGKINDEN